MEAGASSLVPDAQHSASITPSTKSRLSSWGSKRAPLTTSSARSFSSERAPKPGRSSLTRLLTGADILKKLFSDLSSRQLSCGIVKIDVEGFELPILKSIVDTLPSNFKLIVIFENWGHSINVECLKRANQNICLKYLEKKKVLHPLLPKWLNSLFLFFIGGYDIILSTTDEVSNIGDYILEINT